MTRALFNVVFDFWTLWAPLVVMAFYPAWCSRTRVPGAVLGRVPVVRHLGRRLTETRVGHLVSALEAQGLSVEHRPDRADLVERLQKYVLGRGVATGFQAVPFAIPLLGLLWAGTVSDRQSIPPKAAALFLGFAFVSVLIAVVDDWAVRRSDSAGVAMRRGVAALETLLALRGRRSEQGTPVDVLGQRVEALCQALVRQARCEARKAAPITRRAVEARTALLVANIHHSLHGFQTGEEEADRQRARGELVALVSSALRFSCRPRRERNDLRVVAPGLLREVPAASGELAAPAALGTQIAAYLGLAIVLSAMAYLLGRLGVAGEFSGAIAMALLAAAIPALRRLRVPTAVLRPGPDVAQPATGSPSPSGAELTDAAAPPA